MDSLESNISKVNPESEHSPTPWRVVLTATHKYDWMIVDAREMLVASGMLRADAELAVRAVNGHDKLLETARNALKLFDGQGGIPGGPIRDMRKELRDAIKTAEGG